MSRRALLLSRRAFVGVDSIGADDAGANHEIEEANRLLAPTHGKRTDTRAPSMPQLTYASAEPAPAAAAL